MVPMLANSASSLTFLIRTEYIFEPPPCRITLWLQRPFINHVQAFVDGPSSINGVARQSIPLKRLSLTDLTIKIPRSPRLKTLVKAYNDAGIQEKWEKTAWAKKIALRKKRASLNDFDRFKVMVAKKEVCLPQFLFIYFSGSSLTSVLQKSRLVRQEVRKLTKEFHKTENETLRKRKAKKAQ